MQDRKLLQISKITGNKKATKSLEKKIKSREAQSKISDYKEKGYFEKKPSVSDSEIHEGMKGLIGQFKTGIRGHQLASLIGDNEELFSTFGHMFHWDESKTRSEFSPGMLPKIMGHGDVYSLKENHDGRFELIKDVPKGGMGGDRRPVTFITKDNLPNFEKQVGTIIKK